MRSRLATACCTVALLSLTTLSSGGCGGTRQVYDLSGVPPFSHYSGREVTLVRPALLLLARKPTGATTREGAPPSTAALSPGTARAAEPVGIPDYTLTVPSAAVDEAVASGQLFVVASLPEGTPVVIGRTTLRYSMTPWPQQLEFTTIHTDLRFRLGTGSGSRSATAWFDYAVYPPGSVESAGLNNFLGAIRPAPWEAAGTPASRPIEWRDQANRVYKDPIPPDHCRRSGRAGTTSASDGALPRAYRPVTLRVTS